MNSSDLIIGAAFLLVVLFLLLFIRDQQARLQGVGRQLEQYKSTYQVCSGASSNWGDYHLISFDAGNTWYAAKRNGEEIVILGFADEIYPGLLAHLESVHAVKRNGNISKHRMDPFEILVINTSDSN